MKGTHKHTETWLNVLMITDDFLNQKRINVCEHTIKMALWESFGKVRPEWVQGKKGEEWRRGKSNRQITLRTIQLLLRRITRNYGIGMKDGILEGKSEGLYDEINGRSNGKDKMKWHTN